MVTVNCFCDGMSFPFGEATNQRIIMIGKALMMKGHTYRVYVNCMRPRNPLNKERHGIYENIEFHHLNRSLTIGLPKWKNGLNYYLAGFYNAFAAIRLLSKDKNNAIYLYSQGSLFNAFVSLLAHLYRIPVVQEVNEWRDDLDKLSLKSIIYKSFMFRWAKGAISISDNISDKINQYKPAKRKLAILQTPILADKEDWTGTAGSIKKTFLWCGQLDGYFKDVILILKSFSHIATRYPEYKLIICGKYKKSTGDVIEQSIKELNLNRERVVLTGYISNEMLLEYCQTATALISPLWNDQQSSARFPTKIASYLFASRPVLTCKMGETGKYLTDGKDALFFEPGDDRGLSLLMERCIIDEELAFRIGKQGSLVAETQFDFRRHADELSALFNLVSGRLSAVNTITFTTDRSPLTTHQV